MPPSSSPLFPDDRAAPTLKLFVDPPDDGTPNFSASMTLAEFYRAFVAPVCLVHAAPRNLDQYEQSLAYWVEFTGDPPLSGIDDYTVSQFLQELKKLPGRGKQQLADNTVRKHCVHVQYVLDRAGPRSRHNPQGQRLIDEVPILQKPSLVIDEVSDNFTLAEIAWWLEASETAIAPVLRGCTPADFWRSLVLFGYNIGFRVQTLMALRWEWICEDEFGRTRKWIKIPPAAIKKKRGRLFYLTRSACEALDLVRNVTPDEARAGLIFPWPHDLDNTSFSYLQATRRAILAESKIPLARRFGFHGLRKAFGTELAMINDSAAAMALGHSQRNVTIDHYLNKKVMAEAMDRLPQPTWTRPEDPQLRLF